MVPAQTRIGLKLLRPIVVRVGTENILFFCLLRRNQYENFHHWRFALVLFILASKYGTFLLVICMNLVVRNGPSTYVIKKTSFVKIKVDTRVARELLTA